MRPHGLELATPARFRSPHSFQRIISLCLSCVSSTFLSQANLGAGNNPFKLALRKKIGIPPRHFRPFGKVFLQERRPTAMPPRQPTRGNCSSAPPGAMRRRGRSCWSAIGPGCGGWSPSGWTAAWPPASTPPTSSRRPWPRPPGTWTTTCGIRPLPFYPWLRQFAWERLVEAAPPAHPGPAAQRRPRGAAGHAVCPTSRSGNWPAASWSRRHQPQPPPDPRGAARAGPGRAGGAEPRGPRGPGAAVPGADGDRRDRRRAGDQRGGRPEPAVPRPGAAPGRCWRERP